MMEFDTFAGLLENKVRGGVRPVVPVFGFEFPAVLRLHLEVGEEALWPVGYQLIEAQLPAEDGRSLGFQRDQDLFWAEDTCYASLKFS